MLAIRDYESSMQSEVERVYRAYMADLGIPFDPAKHHRDIADIPGSYLRGGGFWCLYDGDALIGMAAVRALGPGRDAAELKRMYVLPEYRGLGCGTALLLRALNFMKSAGFARAVLDTREELTAARRLYENHGFTGIPRYNENAQAELFYGRDLASWEIRPLSVVCPSRQSPQPDFVVVAARFEDRWIWVRHRERDTWEMPGGHVEPGEPPDAAAHRELYEETGAEAFGLTRIGPYGVARDDAMSSGVLYLAEITRLGTLPDFEIAERRLLAEPPGRLTYPAIQPYLNAWAMEWTGSRVSANPAQGPGDGGR